MNLLTSRFKIALFFIAACALSTGASAQFDTKNLGANGLGSGNNAVVQTDQIRAELVAHAPQGLTPGAPVWVGLLLKHQPHWHTYWKNPGDSGLPTTLTWTLPAGLQAGDIAWPTPQKIRIDTLVNLGYEGEVLLPVPVTVAPDFKPGPLTKDLTVQLSAMWLVCREECIPQEGQFTLRIPVQGSTAMQGDAFTAAWAAAPKPHSGAAKASVSAQGMALQVAGLPASWRGKALQAYPETSAVLHTPAIPTSTDTVRAGIAQRDGEQGWDQGIWTAHIPLSAQRFDSPASVDWVLVNGQERLRVPAPVSGLWPATDAPPSVPAALQAALDANAKANSKASLNTQPGGVTTDMVSTSLAELAWVLAAALLGGLILNLMPCVLPVLAIKVLGFAIHADQPRALQRAQGLAYTAGVVASFLALGGLLLALRAGGEQLGWGFQLQTPAVVASLALLFTLIALNLAGWLRVGNLLPQRLATLQLRHPVAEAFLSGVLAVAVASPCTAPFMGASLGYAIALPAAQALGIFAALGLGLALPYLVASWVPAVGRWLPKPGAWMETLRNFLAFPMAATVLWLLWVLGHLNGVDAAASWAVLLLLIGLLVWALGLQGRSRPIIATLSVATGAVWMLTTGHLSLQNQDFQDATVTTVAADTNAIAAGQDWQVWSPQRIEAALAQGRPVFVDFTAAWCITCQVNKRTTLGETEVLADFAQRQVVLMRADWTRRDPAITQALQALGRSGVPVYVLYAPGKKPVVLSELLSPEKVRAALATL
jgi:thiol:disulfide interchange protein/DsbC/DsbD-like thiol-disulfide interchange protein